MFKKLVILIGIASISCQVQASSCSQLTAYYTSMQSYLSMCKSIGVMPGVFGEPNQAGMPITMATVATCTSMMAANKVAAEAVLSMPGATGDTACLYTPAQLAATWSPYIAVLDNNNGFGLLNPCKDPDPRVLLLNKLMFGTMCMTGL